VDNHSATTTATFQITTTGRTPINYQWRKDGVVIPGATNPGLSIVDIQHTHAGIYTVVATNAAGSTTSDSAALVVTLPATRPTVALPPRNLDNLLGTKAEFSVGTTGTVIAELYDASLRATLSIDTPRMVNISVLKPLDQASRRALSLTGPLTFRSSFGLLDRH
jgi:hypothetical protein